MKRFVAVLLSAAIPLAASNVVTDWNTIASTAIVKGSGANHPNANPDLQQLRNKRSV